MKTNDIQRSIDAMLSGMTVSEERKAALLRGALEALPPKPEKPTAPKLKLRFSLSLPLSHTVVAAIVVVLVMIAPLFMPEQTKFFDNWQFGDGEFYMVDGVNKEHNSQVAEADNRPGEIGFFSVTTLEEAQHYYGSDLPVIQWIPDRFELDVYNVNVMAELRSCTSVYQSEEGPIIFEATDYFDPTLAYTYISQDGMGEYITLKNGVEVYATTNAGYQTLAWEEGQVSFLISGSFTREEAIRMAESVRPQ